MPVTQTRSGFSSGFLEERGCVPAAHEIWLSTAEMPMAQNRHWRVRHTFSALRCCKRLPTPTGVRYNGRKCF